jgi:hypothetical protein
VPRAVRRTSTDRRRRRACQQERRSSVSPRACSPAFSSSSCPPRHARLAQAFDDTLILLVEGRIVGPVDAGPGLHGEAGIGLLQLGGGLPLLGCNRACRALGKGPESDQLGRGRPRSKTSASRVRREKAALSSGCEPHPATDPPANTTTPTANAKLSGLIYPPPR